MADFYPREYLLLALEMPHSVIIAGISPSKDVGKYSCLFSSGLE